MMIFSIVTGALLLFFAEIIQPHPQDLHTMYTWMNLAFERGIFQIYQWTPQEVLSRFQEFSPNYPPLIFSLYPFAWLLNQLHLWPSWPSAGANLFFRIPLVLGQIILLFAIYRSLTTRTPKPSFKWFLVLLCLNPAFLIAGPIWGQLNFLLWGIMALSFFKWEDNKPLASALLAALGAITKPQFVMFLPLIGFLLVKKRGPIFCVRWALTFIAAIFLYCSPFILTSGLDCLAKGYLRLAGTQYATADIGYNFWWTLFYGLPIPSLGSDLFTISYSLIAALMANGLVAAYGCIFCFRKTPMDWLKLATLTLLTLFCFLPGMNPQCLVFGVAFLCLSAIGIPNLRIAAITLSIVQCVNLAFNAMWTPSTRFYIGLSTGINRSIGVACFLIIMWGIYRVLKNNPVLSLLHSTDKN